MDWFRLYAEFARDPKLASLNKAQRYDLVCLFCLASESEVPGSVFIDDEDAAAYLSVEEDDWRALKAKLERKSIIEVKGPAEFRFINWGKRQYVSDSSTERVRKHRETRRRAASETGCSVSETLPERCCNGTIADTEQIQSRTETEKTPPDADASSPPGGTESETTGKRSVTPKRPTRRDLISNPPTVEEVDAELSRWPSRAHLAGTSWPQRFLDANAAVGWRYGRGTGKLVVDWKAHCRQWADREQEFHDQKRAERNGDGGPPGRPAYETPEERATRLALERVRAEGYSDED